MKRRWFQFSLRTAMVMMLIATAGIGVYVRWPYYLANRALENASGDTSIPTWSIVREALVNEATFRERVCYSSTVRVEYLSMNNVQVTMVLNYDPVLFRWMKWNINLVKQDGRQCVSTIQKLR